MDHTSILEFPLQALPLSTHTQMTNLGYKKATFDFMRNLNNHKSLKAKVD